MKKTTEQFIKEANLVHNNKYDYSLANYINNKTKVKIICPIHGIFEQRPNNHLNGQGCLKCSGNAKFTIKQFIVKARLIHGNKYDYSLVDYKNKETKVKIICPIHGVFEQKPAAHIFQKHGCQKCAKTHKLSLKDFVIRANIIHNNKYDYSLVNYINAKTKVKIICPIHGIFEQIPSDHLSGHNCPSCLISKGEKSLERYFVDNKILFTRNKKYNDLKDKDKLSYDFYLKDYNLLIEYNGQQHYYNSFHKPIHEWHRQLHHDWLKRKYAKDHNIKLLTISYKDNIIEKIEKILNKH